MLRNWNQKLSYKLLCVLLKILYLLISNSTNWSGDQVSLKPWLGGDICILIKLKGPKLKLGDDICIQVGV